MEQGNPQTYYTKRELSLENKTRQTTPMKRHRSTNDKPFDDTLKQNTKSDGCSSLSDRSDVILISDEEDCNPDETNILKEIPDQLDLAVQENIKVNRSGETPGSKLSVSNQSKEICSLISCKKTITATGVSDGVSESINLCTPSTSRQTFDYNQFSSSHHNILQQEGAYTMGYARQSYLETQDNAEQASITLINTTIGKQSSNQYLAKKCTKQTSVKRDTHVGEEYQKIMQVLVRQRGLATPGSSVGCEIRGVGKFDDIVYIKDGENNHPVCRFFQIKTVTRITMDELFETDLETERKGSFILLRCFIHYCQMKNYATFRDCKFGEATFITKREIEFKSADKICLLKEDNWEKGVQCWNEQDKKSKKFSLIKDSINLHRQEFIKALQEQTENEQLINEFIDNCRIIDRYTDIKHYKKITKECKRTDGEKTVLRYIATPGINRTYSIFQNIVSFYKIINSTELLKHEGKLLGPDINLLLYFESFLKIKANTKYSIKSIGEITFLSTKRVSKNALASLLIQEDLKNDECLYFTNINAKKYKLNIKSEELKKSKDQYINLKNFQSKENEMSEYLSKIRIVVEYPHLDRLKELTFTEVFGHQLEENEEILRDFVIHQEVKELGKRKEFITCEEWRSKINDCKKRMESSKTKGITDFTINKLFQQVPNDVSFEDEELFKAIVQFMAQKQKYILNILVENLTFCSIVVLHTLNRKKVEYKCFTLEHLVTVPKIIHSFKTSESGPIMLIYDVESSLKDSEIKDITSEMVEALIHSSNKIILLSNTNRWNSVEDYSEKTVSIVYSFGFNNLNDELRSNVLSTPIIFQGEDACLGNLFNNDIAFATHVIDERFLWEIIRKQNLIRIGKSVDIDSEVYDEQYFVPRSAFKKAIPISSISSLLKQYLFIALYDSGTNDIDSLAINLVQGGIDNSDIRLWKSSSEKSMEITKNGLVLISIDDYKILSGNKRSKVHSYPRFLIMFKDLNLYFVHVYSITNSSDVSAVTNKNMFEDSRIDQHYLDSNGIFILAADSGSGKSTFLISYAKKLKHEDGNMWVVRVELRKFYNEKRKEKIDEWGDITKSENAIKVVSAMALGDGFEEECYSRLLQLGMMKDQKTNFKLALLLDGYNEINEAFQDITRNLINTLVKHCNYYQIWITTQVNKKIKLEIDLNTPALFLSDLNNEDQVELIARYWETQYRRGLPTGGYNKSDLREDAKIGLCKLQESIHDSTISSFSVVCLNVIMLADYLITRNRKVKQGIDLPSLYDKFFMKRLTLCAKINQSGSENFEVAKNKCFLINMRDIHEEVAARYYFKLYLKREDYKHLPKMDKLDRFLQTEIMSGSYLTTTYNEEQSRDIISKIGVLTWKDDEFDFYHESFAQFFLSEFLWKNVDNGVVQDVLVNFVLVNNDLKLCRKFLEKSLQNIFSKDNIREVNSLDPFQVKMVKKVTRTINFKKTVDLGQVFIEEKLLYTLILFISMQTLGELKTFVRIIKEKYSLGIDLNDKNLFNKSDENNHNKRSSWKNLAELIIHKVPERRNKQNEKVPNQETP